MRRIFGLETEFGVTCATPEGKGISAEEVARYLFRKVVAWGRSSNVFLENGSRLYLDVGSHPEYATAECDDLAQLIAHDKAGELVLDSLTRDAQRRMEEDGVPGRVHLFKNNVDSAGNSFGCHENYLIRRRGDFARVAAALVPFLITRQVLTGAGHVQVTSAGPRYCFSQRADHLWEATSSATTRSRPLINTRDEPHADADLYRRLHVISGDTSMSETTILLKMGMMDLLLRILEEGQQLPDLAVENAVRALREVSHDLSATTAISLATGGRHTAVDIQQMYLDRVHTYLSTTSERSRHDEAVVELWSRGLEALRRGDHSLIDRDLDWAIKKRVIDRYMSERGMPLSDPRVRRMDLAYHDISAERGLFVKLTARGMVNRVITDAQIAEAVSTPPQTTRAKLRGEFVRAANGARRDYTVDWVHLKLNDSAGRTVLCKDPFRSDDERVDRLIASIDGPPTPVTGLGA